MMNMTGFGLDTSQLGNEVFNVDGFASFDFDTGQVPDQSFQPTYTNAREDTRVIRPSDLDAAPFNHSHQFEVSHSVESTLQIDPTLTESKGAVGQQRLARLLTPPTSRSPEHLDAVHSRPGSLTGAATPENPLKHKKMAGTAGVQNGDADDERKLKNRIAASKCRVKKKDREQILIQEKEQKEYENMKLKEEYRQMSQEAIWYKNQLILHGNCGDASINQWLTNSAAKIVHQLGERSARQLDAPCSPVALEPFASPVYERRDSGISTNSKQTSIGNSPGTGPILSATIDLGSPVEPVSLQNVHDHPSRLKYEEDGGAPLGSELMKSAGPQDHKTLDNLAKVAASRAKSIPAPTDENMSPSASTSPLIIDPRLRGGGSALDLPAEYLDISVQQDQNSDSLPQNLGAKWMEA